MQNISVVTAIPTAFAQWRMRWRNWWRRLTPQRQDRFSVLAPLLAVILFLAAIMAAFGYLRLEEIERQAIMQGLREHQNNRTETAKSLGISRRALIYKLQRYREQGFEV